MPDEHLAMLVSHWCNFLYAVLNLSSNMQLLSICVFAVKYWKLSYLQLSMRQIWFYSSKFMYSFRSRTVIEQIFLLINTYTTFTTFVQLRHLKYLNESVHHPVCCTAQTHSPRLAFRVLRAQNFELRVGKLKLGTYELILFSTESVTLLEEIWSFLSAVVLVSTSTHL